MAGLSKMLETTHGMIPNNCAMRKLNVHLVALTTKSPRAHLKRFNR